VRPAMKPAIGFLRPRLASSRRNCAASSSAEPPISPIMMIDLVSSSARNSSSTSMKLVPLTGSPPMPDRGGLAEARIGGLEHGFIGKRAGAAYNADRTLLEDAARHDADLALAGGQHAGAVRTDQPRLGTGQPRRLTLTMSSTGMPSVIVTISGTSASIASRIGIRGEGRRHIDHRCGRAGLRHGLCNGCRRPAGRDASSRPCRG